MVPRILENPSLRTKLSSVSVGIMPAAKNPQRISAIKIGLVMETTVVSMMNEIWVAVSNPNPKMKPVMNAEPKVPAILVRS